jgi:arylsulfatase A-like enzyme
VCRIVESVDLFPTVAALAGLPAPTDVDGVDLSSLFIDPNPTSNPPKPKYVSKPQ